MPERNVSVSDLRVGDQVEVTYVGWVDKDGWIRSHATEACLLAPPHDATVIRLVHRPELELDPAEVEVLAEALQDTHDEDVTRWSALPEYAKVPYRIRARRLIRRNVRVVAD